MKTTDYAILFEINNALAKSKTRYELLRLIFDKVGQIFKFNCPGLFTIDDNEEYHTELTDDNCMMDAINRYVYEHMDSNRYEHKGTAIAYWANLSKPQIFDLKHLHEKIATHPHFPHMISAGLTTTIAGPLNFEGKTIGTLCLSSTDSKAYNNDDLVRFNLICNQLAIALNNIKIKEHLELKEIEKSTQLRIVRAFYEENTWQKKLLETGKVLSKLIPFDFLAFHMMGERFNEVNHGIQKVGLREFRAIALERFLEMSNLSEADFKMYMISNTKKAASIQSKETYLTEKRKHRTKNSFVELFKTSNSLTVPVQIDGEDFSIAFFSRTDNQYNKGHISLFESIKSTFTLAMEKALLYEEVSRLNSILSEEKNYLKEQVEKEYRSNELIGDCLEMQQIRDKIKLVGNVDTNILVLGETGTGKEVVARALHNQSNRKHKPLIKVNCASLPTELIESELFGHEKGAFTGALKRRIGKFELANGGTLFLDEIGEMPLELQPKLLRVIQEKEVERLGGSETIKVDVRIVAATNKDLEEEIEKGTFRADLYFRLSVFPISLPPLRERGGDIDLLTAHFVKKHCKKMKKSLLGVSKTAQNVLKSYQWPGNIRELSNVLERSVLLTEGSVLQLALNPSSKKSRQAPAFEFKTMQQAETELLVATLKLCDGKVRGKNGAAEKLNLAPSTLEYRIKRAGITKKDIFR